MRTKAEYEKRVSSELAAKVPGHAVSSILEENDELVLLGFRAQVHPKACAGVIAISDAVDRAPRGRSS